MNTNAMMNMIVGTSGTKSSTGSKSNPAANATRKAVHLTPLAKIIITSVNNA